MSIKTPDRLLDIIRQNVQLWKERLLRISTRRCVSVSGCLHMTRVHCMTRDEGQEQGGMGSHPPRQVDMYTWKHASVRAAHWCVHRPPVSPSEKRSRKVPPDEISSLVPLQTTLPASSHSHMIPHTPSSPPRLPTTNVASQVTRDAFKTSTQSFANDFHQRTSPERHPSIRTLTGAPQFNCTSRRTTKIQIACVFSEVPKIAEATLRATGRSLMSSTRRREMCEYNNRIDYNIPYDLIVSFQLYRPLPLTAV